jgi:hypothetical protein
VVVERRRLCVFPVFSVAVMEKCCDACGDEECYIPVEFSASKTANVQKHRLPLTEVDGTYGG